MTDLAETLENLDIEEYLDSEGVVYKKTRGRSGDQLNLKSCPACGSDNWKVFLNAETGLGNCFSGSCQAKFNKYTFIRYLHDFPGSRDTIIHIEQYLSQRGWRPKRKTKIIVESEYKEIRLPKSYELPINGKNLKYLSNRGINSDCAKHFGLRFCNAGYYANRVIIPVYDLDGTLASFQARDITGNAEDRYLFPAGFASTGNILFNGQNAIGFEEAIIAEGVFDVIAVHNALTQDPYLKNKVAAIGSFGIELSENTEGNDQINKLYQLKKNGLKRITMMWDGEFQATKKAIEACKRITNIGLEAQISILPKDTDPNEIPSTVLIESFYRAKQPANVLKDLFKLGLNK